MNRITLKTVSHYQNTYEIDEEVFNNLGLTHSEMVYDYDKLLKHFTLVSSVQISEDVFHKEISNK
jgi:hypothetical protein